MKKEEKLDKLIEEVSQLELLLSDNIYERDYIPYKLKKINEPKWYSKGYTKEVIKKYVLVRKYLKKLLEKDKR